MGFAKHMSFAVTVLICCHVLKSFGFQLPIDSVRRRDHKNRQHPVFRSSCQTRRTTTATRAQLADFESTLLSPALSSSSLSLSSSSSFLLSGDDGLFGFNPLFVLLSLGIGAFAYANLKFTPEIIENTENMRLQLRESEVRKLVQVVMKQQQQQQGQQRTDGFGDLREPLETAFGMTIEEYVAAVDKYFSTDRQVDATSILEQRYTSADKELADILRPIS